MKTLRVALILGLAVGCATWAFASPGKRMKFVANDSGAVTVPAWPSGKPASSFFIESGWAGSVSEPASLGGFHWSAVGTFTVEDLSDTPWDIHVTGVRFVLDFGSGDTIQGTFSTQGSLNDTTWAINTSGPFVFTSGTGKFAKVKGAGTIAAQGTAQNATCPMTGWIEY